MIRVISADDHPLIQAGLDALFSKAGNIQLSGSVANSYDLIHRLREDAFDVAVIDIQMPGRNGIELIKHIKKESPNLPIVVLSTYKEELYALRTLRAGASAYICKDHTVSDLVAAVQAAYEGRRYINATVAELLADNVSTPSVMKSRHGLLSDREYQIFLMLAQGQTPTQIADRLSLSVKTISTHKARIKDKMKFANDSDFIHYALEKNLIAPLQVD